MNNRFDNIPAILSRELLPWESRRLGLSETTGQFQQVGGFWFWSDIAGGWIRVEDGEISDLASIPNAAAALFGINTDDQRIAGGAWVHDKGYRAYGKLTVWNMERTQSYQVQVTRKQTDQILCFEAMKDLGATGIKQMVAYQALRRFGCQWPGNGFTERFT